MNRINRRAAVTWLGLGLASVHTVPARAAGFPERPITFLLGVPPGGFSDAQARALAAAVTRQLGQPVVVVNRPGMASTLAPASLAQARPDGYTIAMMPTSLTRLPHLQKTTWHPLRDFTYVMNITNSPMALVVRQESPFKSLADLLAHAKANPRAVSYGTNGVGSVAHVVMEQVARQAGVVLNAAQFKGSADMYQALLGGHIDAVAHVSFAPLLESGKARALAILSEKRLERFPAIPTLQDLGYTAVVRGGWGIGAPAGTDPAVVRVLHDAFKAALADPVFLASVKAGDQTLTYMDPVAYTDWIARQYAEDARTVKELGFKLE